MISGVSTISSFSELLVTSSNEGGSNFSFFSIFFLNILDMNLFITYIYKLFYISKCFEVFLIIYKFILNIINYN